MNATDWRRIRHFTACEAWGDPRLMVFSFVHLLDCFRDFLDKSIVISKGTQGTHVQTSLHFAGKAVDAVLPGTSIRDAVDIFIAASRFGFTEIGIYVGWEYEGEPVVGIHLAYSEPNPNEVSRKHYWIGTDKTGADGTPERVPLTYANLRLYGFAA